MSLINLDRILLFGGTGQVGNALQRTFSSVQGNTLHSIPILETPSPAEANFSQLNTLHPILESFQPTLVINAAAYTQVDRAEKEETLTKCINAEAPALLASWCAEKNIPFVHYSTDYVYSGQGVIPWKEEDPIAPLNAYGRSKALGDEKIIQTGGKYLIFRTSWVYHSMGENFLKTILRLAQERSTLKIVSDQYGAPTYALHLAEGTWEILKILTKCKEEDVFPSGIYHFCHQGETSWSQFAEKIWMETKQQGIELKLKKIEPISSTEYPSLARRPFNSRLDTRKVQNTFRVQLPDWSTGLQKCLQEVFKK